MRVNIANVFRRDACLLHSLAQQRLQGLAVFWQRGHVVGVAVGDKTDDLGIDMSMTGQGRLAFFQEQYACTLCHYETVALPIVGARSLFGGVVARTEGLHHGKNVDAGRVDGGIGTAREHSIGASLLNGPVGLAHRIPSRRTARSEDHASSMQTKMGGNYVGGCEA